MSNYSISPRWESDDLRSNKPIPITDASRHYRDHVIAQARADDEISQYKNYVCAGLQDSIYEFKKRLFDANGQNKSIDREMPIGLKDRALQSGKKGYNLSDQHKRVLNDLVHWVFNDPRCSVPLHKGICLYGNPGSGKSLIMQTLSDFSKYFMIRPFGFFDLKTKVGECIDAKSSAPILPGYKGNKCIDELGFEDSDTSIWGNKINLVGDLLTTREKSGFITHATTNCSNDELMQKYGDRVFSRIHSLWTVIRLDSIDHRRI